MIQDEHKAFPLPRIPYAAFTASVINEIVLNDLVFEEVSRTARVLPEHAFIIVIKYTAKFSGVFGGKVAEIDLVAFQSGLHPGGVPSNQ